MNKVILVDHGSRNPLAHDQFEQLLEQIEPKLKGVSVSLCHMEIAEPSLKEVLNQSSENGYKNIRVIPLFMFAGRHLEKDIPEIINEYEKSNPTVKVVLERSLGSKETFAKYLFQEIETLELTSY